MAQLKGNLTYVACRSQVEKLHVNLHHALQIGVGTHNVPAYDRQPETSVGHLQL